MLPVIFHEFAEGPFREALDLANQATFTPTELDAYQRVIDEINQARELAEAKWDEGRKSGLAEGHELGVAEGHKSGVAEGHKSGVAEGHKSGLAEGKRGLLDADPRASRSLAHRSGAG